MNRRGSDIDEVFRSSPADFVRTRNRVAAQLRAAGQTREAAEIARLRKPSPALWAVNRLAAEARTELTDFLQAVERLQQRQPQGRSGLGQANEHQRQALDRLVRRAGAILAAAHLSTSPAVLGKVSATLRGAAVDREGRAALRAGRLSEERMAPGFEAFAGWRGAAAARPAAEAPRPMPTEAPGPRAAEAARRTGAAREARRRAEGQARTLAAQAARLERQFAQQQRAANRAAKVVAVLTERLRRAEARLAKNRQAADEAGRLAQTARREAEEATSQIEGPR